MAVGKVRWVSESLGYGFIEREDGETFFVHCKALHLREPQPIRMGERVAFEIHDSARGPQATNVNRL